MKQLLAALVLILTFASCKKEVSVNTPRELMVDHFGLTQHQLLMNKAIADRQPQLDLMARRFPKKPHPHDPVDTTGGGGGGTDNPPPPPPPPPPTGGYCVLVDFDGQTVSGTSWNVNGAIYAQPANLDGATQARIIDTIQLNRYAGLNVLVTADSTVYFSYDAYHRQRIILTPTYEWFGTAGGVAYLGSMKWGDGTPAFVFTSLLGNNEKNIAEATAHEGGHTMGLYHQAKWLDASGAPCLSPSQTPVTMVSAYDDGQYLDHAPIMGVGYYRSYVKFHAGYNSNGQWVDELAALTAFLQ